MLFALVGFLNCMHYCNGKCYFLYRISLVCIRNESLEWWLWTVHVFPSGAYLLKQEWYAYFIFVLLGNKDTKTALCFYRLENCFLTFGLHSPNFPLLNLILKHKILKPLIVSSASLLWDHMKNMTICLISSLIFYCPVAEGLLAVQELVEISLSCCLFPFMFVDKFLNLVL